MTCLKSQSLANSLNSLDEYCGPLSLTTISGIPYLEKCEDNFLITAVVDVVVNSSNSKNLL